MQERKRICDSNEPWSIVGELIKAGWERQHLYSADYWFFNSEFKKVGVERKTISDLLSSLGDRMSKQLQAMTEHYDICVLLLEGSWQQVRGQVVTGRGIENWGWTTVWNFLRSWQDRGITLELTVNERHTIKRLNELYAYYAKPAHSGGFTRRQVGDDRLLARPVLVGIKTMEEVLKHFGSLRNVANASLDDFLKVDGVGAKRAESLVLYYNRDTRGKPNATGTDGEVT